GSFSATAYASGGVVGTNKGPVAVAVGDVNGDGRRDLIATNYSNQSVGVLLNTYQFLASAPAAGLAELSLYPNPAHENFAVELPAGTAGPVQVELLNTLGQVVHRQQEVLAAGSPRLRVEAAGLPAGAYTVRLQAGARVLARRVLLR
ncbi:MAG: T9SS type A sorting domain-containing protein, partial [Hymenobacter sp.]